MNRVERAIIMAAGKGKRMRELTHDLPKPLIPVNGKPMIESAIQGILANGIPEILIIVGYQKEKFREIAERYPQVKLVENPYYDSCNNISSIYMVRDRLRNAMILEGDQFYFSPEPLKAEFEHSEYNVSWTDEPTQEWVMDADENGKMLACHDQGAPKGWMVYGVSRWTAEDGERLKELLTYEFEEKMNRQCYWDRVPVFLYPDRFDIHIRPTDGSQRVELDSVEELCRVDPSYSKYLRKEED